MLLICMQSDSMDFSLLAYPLNGLFLYPIHGRDGEPGDRFSGLPPF